MMHISERISPDNQGYSQMLKGDANVFFVRNCEKEAEECTKKGIKNPSRQKLGGIIRHLQQKKELGLIRLSTKEDRRRFRELIGHDSLMHVFDKKASTAEVKKLLPLKNN